MTPEIRTNAKARDKVVVHFALQDLSVRLFNFTHVKLRLASPQIGSRRCHDLNETTCILSQWGSGPDTNSSGTGHYTSKDYREILQHAKEKHVQVIPEIDMPGHSHAAITAMLDRYKKYRTENNAVEGERYLLSDLEDESDFQSIQLFKNNAINPCLNSTYTFVKNVVSELMRIHSGIQPLRVIHVGGDEVSKFAWSKSPVCAQLAKNLKIARPTHAHWMQYFLVQVASITAQHGLNLAVWEDAVMNGGKSISNKLFRNKRVYPYAWHGNHLGQAYNMANAGFKVRST